MLKTYLKQSLGCSLTALMAVLATHSAHAQTGPARPSEQIQEIIITAQKKTENLQKASIAVDALAPGDIAKQGIKSATDLQTMLPAVKFIVNSIIQVSIRGLGTSDINPGVDSSVAYSEDGIYLAAPQAMTPVLFDLQRVEAVLGPQGTLYGRNSNGGVINFITKDPVFKYGGDASVGFGNYGAINSEAAINIPLTDELALRVAEGSEKHNGYQSDGSNNADNIAGRAKLLYKPNGDLSVLLAVTASQQKSAGPQYSGYCPPNTNDPACAGVPQNPWSGLYPDAHNFRNDDYIFGVSAHIDYNLGWANLTSLTGYRGYNSFTTTSAPWYNGVDNLNFVDNGSNQFITQEVRLASEANSPISWVGGIYYSHSSETDNVAHQYVSNTIPKPNVSLAFPISSAVAQSEAVFGEVTVPIPMVEGLRLRAGGRYTHETKDANGLVEKLTLSTGANAIPPVPTGAAEAIWRATWKAGLDYDVTPTNLLYFTASTGFKSGGVNILPGVASGLLTYAPEFITAEEIGTKNRFFDGRLQVNADLFHYGYKNYQAYEFWRPNATAPAELLGSTIFATVNSQTATFEGGELNAKWRVTPSDMLGFDFNLLHDTFNQFTIALPYSSVINLSNTEVPQAPQTTYSVSYAHDFSMPNGDILSVGGNSSIVASQLATGNYTVAGQALEYRQPAYHKTGANVSYQTAEGGWTITAYIRNIENVAVVNSVSAGYPIAVQVSEVLERADAPRTFGMAVRKEF